MTLNCSIDIYMDPFSRPLNTTNIVDYIEIKFFKMWLKDNPKQYHTVFNGMDGAPHAWRLFIAG
jgi:hypothetical protein